MQQHAAWDQGPRRAGAEHSAQRLQRRQLPWLIWPLWRRFRKTPLEAEERETFAQYFYRSALHGTPAGQCAVLQAMPAWVLCQQGGADPGIADSLARQLTWRPDAALAAVSRF